MHEIKYSHYLCTNLQNLSIVEKYLEKLLYYYLILCTKYSISSLK